MAEASQEETTLDRRTRIDFTNRIFRLIEENSLDEIKQIFENLHPEQCIQILNSSINGVIPLCKAITHNNIEMSHYFLQMSLLQGRRKMAERWKTCQHPLIAAILVNNLELIEMILQHLYDINDNIFGPYPSLIVATMLGNLMSVKLIVSMGADINQLCLRGRNSLMYSTTHSDICCYLLSKGPNVNHQDENGFTALHFAVVWNCMESIQLLINAGADLRIRAREGSTPLLGALINLNMPMFQYLVSQIAYSQLDLIEAWQILNAFNLCAQIPFIHTWEYYLRRRIDNLPRICQISPQEILDFSEEFVTDTELETNQDNRLHLAFQGILVVERILGRKNRFFVQFLLQTALIAKQENNMEQLLHLIEHVQEYCQETYFVGLNLSYFINLFTKIAEHNDPKIFFEYGGFTIFKIIAQAAVKRWNLLKVHVYTYPVFEDCYYPAMVDNFLYIMSRTKTFLSSEQYLSQFREVLKTVLKEDPRLPLHLSILHRAVKLTKTSSWCSVDLIKILLESGADPNSKDYFRRTPIMYAVKHVPEPILNDVLAVLIDYGGHPDCRNNEGFTAFDNSPLESCLNIKPRSLQCLATEVILDKKLTYRGILPKIIENFVNLHE